MRHDVTFPLYVEVDEIYNLACPASPIHYQHDPVQTTKTSVHGAINMLGLAKRLKAKILQASTSEVYGDPTVHPQTESYWGNVNPIGPRSCYDEGKRCAETLFFDYHRQHRLRDQGRAHLQHLRPAHASERRPRGVQLHRAGAARRADHDLRRRQQTRSFCYVDDLIEGLMRLMDTPDDCHRAGQPRQPGRVHHPASWPSEVIELTGFDVADRCSSRCRADDPRQRQPDIALARALLGWEPKVQLREGLSEDDRLLREAAWPRHGGSPMSDADPGPCHRVEDRPATAGVDVSIVIVNWNSRDHLQACLSSLSADLADDSFEAIVVDSGSFDGADEMIRERFPAVRFVQSQDNIGFGRANNLGVRRARGRTLILLIPDTVVPAGALHQLRDALDSLPDAGLVGCRLINTDGSLQLACVQAFPSVLNQCLNSRAMLRWFPRVPVWTSALTFERQSHPIRVDAVIGACMVMRRDLFCEVGGFKSRLLHVRRGFRPVPQDPTRRQGGLLRARGRHQAPRRRHDRRGR